MMEYSWSSKTIRSTPLRNLDLAIRLFEGIFFENLSQVAQKRPIPPQLACSRTQRLQEQSLFLGDAWQLTTHAPHKLHQSVGHDPVSIHAMSSVNALSR